MREVGDRHSHGHGHEHQQRDKDEVRSDVPGDRGKQDAGDDGRPHGPGNRAAFRQEVADRCGCGCGDLVVGS